MFFIKLKMITDLTTLIVQSKNFLLNELNAPNAIKQKQKKLK